MSKMNNWMMEIEAFCNGYSYGGMNDFTVLSYDFTVDEVVEDVGMYFKSNEATKYAKQYLTTQIGEM